MRTFAFLFCTTIFSFSPKNGFSQDADILINSDKKVSIEEVFTLINKKVGYKFIYRYDLIKDAPSITLKKGIIKVGALLKKGLAPIHCTFNFANNTFVVRQKTVAEQQIEIKGVVKDEKDQPLPGAIVMIKGTSKRVVTNFDGEYNIVGWTGEILVFSYTGYKTIEIPLRGSNRIDVTMFPKINNLDEVVVVAYGKTTKKDLTGAVSTIDPKKIRDYGFNTIDQMLQGSVSGVYGLSSDGSPGGRLSIRIRGITSIVGANEPLYVIDGVPIQVEDRTVGLGRQNFINNPYINPLTHDHRLRGDEGAFNRGVNPLSFLNINDIKSVTILKDASATSLYGSRASNGVIIITTKRGKKRKSPEIAVSTRVTVKNAFRSNLLNAQEYKKIMTIATANTRVSERPHFADQILDPNSDFFGNSDTDWISEVTRVGVTNEQNISVNGGGENTTYYIGASSLSEQGTIKTSKFQSNSFNLNLNTKVNSKLDIRVGTNYNRSINNLVNDVFNKAYYARPDFPVKQADGSFTRIGVVNLAPNRPANQFNENPVAILEEDFQSKTNSFLLSAFGTYKMTKSLSLISNFSVNQITSKVSRFQPKFVIPIFFNINGVRSETVDEQQQFSFDSRLAYRKVFNQHSVSTIMGVNFQLNEQESISASGSGFPDSEVLNNLGSATDPNRQIGGARTKSRLHSYFSRLDYNFKGKYYVTLSARVDASSKFAKDTRYGFFPSAALAWNLSSEPFLSSKADISLLKIRASAGVTGSNQLSDFAWRTLYASGESNYGENPTIVPIQIGNNNLRWETSKDFNLGIDFDFFKGKLFGSITGYYKKTDNLLIPLILPASSGHRQVTANLAAIENKGTEIEIGTRIINNENVLWDFKFNHSWNKNKVLDLEGPAFSDPLNRSLVNNRGGVSIIQEGESIGSIYGFVVQGIYQSQQEIDKLNAALPPGQLYDINARPGEFRYKDLNGDNQVDHNDRTVIGKATPDFYGGVTSTFRYKGLSLQLFGQFSIGNDLYWLVDSANSIIDNTNNLSKDVLNAWAPDNTGSNRPILTFRPNNDQPSDFFVHDASYFRLKSLTIGYSISPNILKNSFFKGVNIYFTGTNLFTLTNYPGMDPETNAVSNPVFSGLDANTFPQAKSYTLGIRFRM